MSNGKSFWYCLGGHVDTIALHVLTTACDAGSKKIVQKFTDQASNQAQSIQGRGDTGVVMLIRCRDADPVSCHLVLSLPRAQAEVLSLKMEVCLATERLHAAKVDQENAEVGARLWPRQRRGLTLACIDMCSSCMRVRICVVCANVWCARCQRAHLEVLSQHQRTAAEEKLKLQRIIMVRGTG